MYTHYKEKVILCTETEQLPLSVNDEHHGCSLWEKFKGYEN